MTHEAILGDGAEGPTIELPTVISIDPPTARDLDDAIGCKRREDGGWTVDICVPDVPSALIAGSPEDIAAERLGMTIYAATGIRRSMLGEGAGERWGLSASHDRRMIHFRFEVSPDLIATVSTISRIVHRTSASMTYGQADAVLAEPDHPLHAAMSSLWDLARRLHDERAAATGAVFNVDERVYTDEDGQRQMLDDATAHRSNMIVMEMMVLANAALARHAKDNGLPVIYRNFCLKGFESGDRASAAAELARRECIGRNVACRRLRSMVNELEQAQLETTPRGHHALDVPAYAWFTSPLRRYADVVNLRALIGEADDRDLKAVASHLNEVHQQQKQSSSEHHGRVSRRRIVRNLARSDLRSLDQWDLHTIVKALIENPGFDQPQAMRLVADRMARDELSGKDIKVLVDGAKTLFGNEGQVTISAWMDHGSRRERLSRHLEGERPSTPMATINHKGALLERATKTGAVVDFTPARRRGPVHDPLFEVSASWTHHGQESFGHGIGRTVKSAENHAAAELLSVLDKLPKDEEARHSPTTSNPKSRLLEIVAATKGASAVFSAPEMKGPPHAPTFFIQLKIVMDGRKLKFTGTGGSRKEAERDASQNALDNDWMKK